MKSIPNCTLIVLNFLLVFYMHIALIIVYCYLGVQVVRLPTICKAPFDLYQIFNSVQHHGGFLNVSHGLTLTSLVRCVLRVGCALQAVVDILQSFKACPHQAHFEYAFHKLIILTMCYCSVHIDSKLICHTHDEYPTCSALNLLTSYHA